MLTFERIADTTKPPSTKGRFVAGLATEIPPARCKSTTCCGTVDLCILGTGISARWSFVDACDAQIHTSLEHRPNTCPSRWLG